MADHPAVQAGQRWRDVDTEAVVLAVVQTHRKGRYAVLQRLHGPSKFSKPFLYRCVSMERGDDGWTMIGDPTP